MGTARILDEGGAGVHEPRCVPASGEWRVNASSRYVVSPGGGRAEPRHAGRAGLTCSAIARCGGDTVASGVPRDQGGVSHEAAMVSLRGRDGDLRLPGDPPQQPCRPGPVGTASGPAGRGAHRPRRHGLRRPRLLRLHRHPDSPHRPPRAAGRQAHRLLRQRAGLHARRGRP